jgi:WD40 repeat protein
MSFTEEDAGLFFGREAEVVALWGRLRNRRLLAVIAPSGAGKTSLVRAGVVASRPEGWAALVCTPGSSPMRSLGQTLAPELSGDHDALRKLVGFDDPETAYELVVRWRKAHAEALVVVDQFEELFTLGPTEAQGRFAALLGRLSKDGDVHVLLSMRDDFLIRCSEQEALSGVFLELTPLPALSREGLVRALVEPAKRRGFRFEDEGLVEEMVASVEGARGALPLLAFAISRLWERRDRDRKLLTRAAYEEIGGVAGALAQHAEATMDRIGTERQAIVRELFRNLVTAQGTRAVAEREELLSVFPDRKSAEEVLEELIEARLLTSFEMEGREGEPSGHRIEIAHESLLRAWPRLVRWQAQDEEGAVLRDQLKQAAHLWEEKGRTSDILWTGTAFQEYELWRGRYQGALTALEEDFARAMRDKARRRRRLVRAAAIAAVLGSSAVAIAVAASRHQAVLARERAEAETRRAEASRVLTLAQLRLADDPTEALAFATASLELADTPEARVFVMKALWEAPPSLTLPVGPPVQRFGAFSPDGTRLAAGDHDPVELLWKESGGPPIALEGNEISPRGSNLASWSGDGHLVTGLCCALATRAHVWSAEGKRLRTVEFGAPTTWQVGKEHLFGETEEGPAGHRAALLRSWRLKDGELSVLGRVPRRVVGPSSPRAFLPDGAAWVHAREDALFLRPLPEGTGQGDRPVGRHGADVVELWPDGSSWDRLYSRDQSGEMRTWRVAGGLALERVITRPATAPPTVFRGEQGWVHGNAWADKRVRLWDLEALPGSRPLELRRSGSWYLAWPNLHPRGDWLSVFQIGEARAAFWPLRRRYPSIVDGYTPVVRPVAFSPDGKWIATGWSDSKLRLWPVPGASPREPRTLQGPETGFWSRIVFDPGGRYLFAVGLADHAWIVPLDGSRPRRLPSWSEDTLLRAAAVSPSGRQVATAWNFGPGEKTLRLHDVETGATRVLPLPTETAGSAAWSEGEKGAVGAIEFLDETTAFTSGWAGLRRWDLERGTSTLVAANVELLGLPGPDRSVALTTAAVPGRDASLCQQAQVRDLVSGKATVLFSPETCVAGGSGGGSGGIAAVPGPDGVLVGRIAGANAHLLVGHQGLVHGVAVSPDGRWVATSGEDNTLRLWPVPDLSRPPLHTLPHDQLLAKLRTLTNLRVVRDPGSPAGWKIEIGPFPGWKDVPTW